MTQTIGFIGGGQMAEALIKGILSAQLFSKENIHVAEPHEPRRKQLTDSYGINVHEHGTAVWQKCTTIVLAVKPQIMGSVLDDSRDMVSSAHLLISIAAGLPIKFFKTALHRPDLRIIRVMPNTPALVLSAASALAASGDATEEDMALTLSIFSKIGKAVVLGESDLDAVTGLSGSGPAYVFTFIEAMIDAGIKEGLPRPIAQTLALQTISGSVKLVEETGKHPAELRSMVTSPGGTTIAAQHVLEKAGLRGSVMDAVSASAARSRELGSE
ncbi:MAG: pyrroline-5-carboxylate reductase [Thermodesulfobacteriota bacterium]